MLSILSQKYVRRCVINTANTEKKVGMMKTIWQQYARVVR